jgi:hypothetical protein
MENDNHNEVSRALGLRPFRQDIGVQIAATIKVANVGAITTETLMIYFPDLGTSEPVCRLWVNHDAVNLKSG